ncbi:glycosyl hydrolase [Croceivirga lutea]|uniref:TIGR04283 family arsenosugar biosynthesis glycosyltransferase n=1 Tax=Croceivirga lutea TaxID=1775167 RepID=UPI00163B0452|nr:TIGR04283 family arsenosugar biosynthesis glycosyltransferase [Croceivirga lutea]GGG36042.1 glycosyl hydrolase [Croceivirga lutea]
MSLLSIIIPVLNEENNILKLLEHLKAASFDFNNIEIICVDGGSTDQTIVQLKNSEIPFKISKKGRALQMNAGAEMAKGKILYFLHADTLPPKHFDLHIRNAVLKNWQAGCFRMQFAPSNLFLDFFAFLAQFNLPICRGGDQSLFITKSLFDSNYGFNTTYKIYEDVEFTNRLYKHVNFKILKSKVITSSRRYQQKGFLKLQYHFGIIHLKNLLGKGPNDLHNYYQKYIA